MSRLAAFALLASVLGACSVPYKEAPTYEPPSLGGQASSRELTRPPDPEDRPSRPLPDASGALSADDCVALALRNNRGVWLADRRVLIARDRIDEAISQILPKLTLEGHYDWRSNQPGVTFNGQNLVTGDQGTLSARAGLLVPIYEFGRAWWTLEAEQRRVDATDREAERARQSLTFAVRSTYFRVLEAEKIRDVVQESIHIVERQLEIARDFLAQGLVAKSDVLSAEVSQGARRQDLIEAQNNIELARASLNRLIGVDVNAATRIQDTLERDPWRGSLEKAMRVAVERRPDLAALRRMIEVQRAEYEVVQRGNMPLFYGTAEYNYRTDSFLLHKDWFGGGVGLTIPVFDGLATQFAMKRKTKEIAQSIDLHDERMDEAVLDVKQSWLLLRSASERVPLAKKSIELAEENLRVIRDQYGEGLVSSTDVLLEEERRSRSRSSHVRALYDLHSAMARLEYSIGAAPPEN